MKRGWGSVFEIVRRAERGELLTRSGDFAALRETLAGFNCSQRRYLLDKLRPFLTYDGISLLFNYETPARRSTEARP